MALAVEFKFSPAPERFPEAIRRTTFPVLAKTAVVVDTDRGAIIARARLADEAVAVVIDEGGTVR